MAKLNAKQMEIVRPILQRYRAQLDRSGGFDHHGFERELRDALGTNYLGMKDYAEALLKDAEGRFVALYWMQHNNPGGPQSEFQGDLAEAYGIESYYHHGGPELAPEFWKSFPTHRGDFQPEPRNG